jgi:hypothetical protein
MWVNKLKTNPLPVRDNTVQRVISLKCTVKQIYGGPEQRQPEIHVARNVTFYRPLASEGRFRAHKISARSPSLMFSQGSMFTHTIGHGKFGALGQIKK